LTFAGLPLTTLLGIGAVVGALTVALYVLKLRRRPVPVPFTRLWQQVLSDEQSSSLFSRLRQLLSLLLQLVIVTALVLALGDPRAEGHREAGRTFVVLLDASASMAATDTPPSRLERGREEVLRIIEGMAAADRMLLVRMGATPTPLTTLTDDAAALKSAVEGVRTSDTGADFEAALRLALDALRGQPEPEIVLVSDGALVTAPRGTLLDGEDEEGREAASGTTAPQGAPGGTDADPAGAMAVTADSIPRGAEGAGETPEQGEPPALRSPLLDQAREQGVRVSYVPVGVGGRNVALTQFAVRRYPLDKSRHEALVELTNTDPEPVEVELALYGDGVIVDVQRLSLRAGEVLRRLYPDLGGASAELMAEVRLADGRGDDLPADDRAYAMLPERRRARVLLVTEGNTYLEAAVLLDEYLQVTEVAPADYPPPGDFDVTIFDGVAPPRDARTGAALYLGLPGPTNDEASGNQAPLEQGPELEMFGFDHWDEKSPFLRWMAMPDIQVLTGRALIPRPGDRVLGWSEALRGKRTPILVGGRRPEGEFVVLGFDPRRSDLVLRVAWPLFVLNVIDAFTDESAEALSAYRTGQVWRVPLGSRGAAEEAEAVPARVRVRQPDGSEIEAPVVDGHAVLFGEQAGFHRIEGTQPPVRFAANLARVEESHIEPRKTLMFSGATPDAEGAEVLTAGPVEGLHAGTQQRWWILLLLGAVGLSLIEWITYHRRWTV
jgi:hypothetical protein